jgi:hypothetical protein
MAAELQTWRAQTMTDVESLSQRQCGRNGLRSAPSGLRHISFSRHLRHHHNRRRRPSRHNRTHSSPALTSGIQLDAASAVLDVRAVLKAVPSPIDDCGSQDDHEGTGSHEQCCEHPHLRFEDTTGGLRPRCGTLMLTWPQFAVMNVAFDNSAGRRRRKYV